MAKQLLKLRGPHSWINGWEMRELRTRDTDTPACLRVVDLRRAGTDTLLFG